MRNVQQTFQQYSTARRCLAAVRFLLCVLLLDFALTLFAVGHGDVPSVPSPAPESYRSAAERAGNLAAMHEGAGNGVHLQMRGGRTSPTFARRLQTEMAHFEPGRILESVPNRLQRIESPEQTFLFQLFPRCFLPVRAGPVTA